MRVIFLLRCGSSPNYVELRRLLCSYLLSADISTRFSYGLQGIFENVKGVPYSRFQAVNANSPGNEGQGFIQPTSMRCLPRVIFCFLLAWCFNHVYFFQFACRIQLGQLKSIIGRFCRSRFTVSTINILTVTRASLFFSPK